jgi:predicted permease
MIHPNAIVGLGASDYFSGASQIATANAMFATGTIIDGETRASVIHQTRVVVVCIRAFAHFLFIVLSFSLFSEGHPSISRLPSWAAPKRCEHA